MGVLVSFRRITEMKIKYVQKIYAECFFSECMYVPPGYFKRHVALYLGQRPEIRINDGKNYYLMLSYPVLRFSSSIDSKI